MVRIAVMADIHANPFALEAVIEDIITQAPDEIIVAGDLVGRGPMGAAVVERVRGLGWPCVRGNHEDYMINFFHERVPAQWLTDDYWAASVWMAKELGQEHVSYIETLPFSLSPQAAPSMLVVHGTTRSNQEGVGTWTSDEELLEIFELAQPHHDLIVCAHTHRALVCEAPGRGLVVNVGSVGLPFNGDWRAQYAIFTRHDERWEVELRQVPYDRDAFMDGYSECGFLAAGTFTSAMLLQEIKHARPFLVPFLRWVEYLEKPATMESVPEFLDFYDCNLSTRKLMEQLELLKAR